MRISPFIILLSFIVILLTGCSDPTPLELPSSQSTVIHVSPGGVASAPGTAQAPVSTIPRALDLAQANGAREIRIAFGEYQVPSLHLVGGIDMTGGWNPTTWTRSSDGMSVLICQNHSITAMDIQTPTLIENLYFRSGNSLQNHQIALVLFGCGPELHFSHCSFKISHGEDGRPGQNGRDGSPPTAGHSGGDGAPGTCLGSISAPGGEAYYSFYSTGGTGGLPGQPGSAGMDGWLNHDFPNSGHGGPASLPGQPGNDGENGFDSPDGDHGLPPPSRLHFQGTSSDLPNPTNGEYGGQGGLGGGGSGGGGSISGTGNGGGAGGLGGYSGSPGHGGCSGNHSIAVFCQSTSARFSGCTFQAEGGGAGGTGGNGGLARQGSPGGLGGTECSPEVGAGGNGGHGGTGCNSGAGAGGHGGDSIGVLIWGNIDPVIDDDCIFQIAPAGIAGQGGVRGNGLNQAPSGWDGRTANIFEEDIAP